MKTSKTWLRHFPCRVSIEDRGAELVEAALVIPLLLSLVFGIISFGRAYNVYETITRAAREGARVAVVRTCALCGNSIPSDSEVRTAVTQALAASSLDPAKVTNTFSGTCPSGQTCDCPSADICIIRDVPLNSGTPQELGVAVSFGYPFRLTLPFTSVKLTSINISTSVRMREEN